MKPALRVRILRRAQQDLLEIDHYLEKEAPERRPEVLDHLLTSIGRLGVVPRMGPEPRDSRLKGLGFRYLSVGHYILFYKIAGHQLRVYRVLHARRDYWPFLR
jgi:addiction module RelE/StbE family toxin